MTTELAEFTTAELSLATWPDYESFFRQVGSGWCGCMLYPRGCHLPASSGDRLHVLERNLADKKSLVDADRAHGILVYERADPVGWCQYGPVEELPVDDLPRSTRQRIRRAVDPTSRWRITCFITARPYRRRGVASTALSAALASIEQRRGGWVEATPIAAAYPHIDQQARRLQRIYGKRSTELDDYLAHRPWPEVMVRGIGPVKASRGSFGNAAYSGTVSMFERQGFSAIRELEWGRVLMRRLI